MLDDSHRRLFVVIDAESRDENDVPYPGSLRACDDRTEFCRRIRVCISGIG